jgi:hypothetical protein
LRGLAASSAFFFSSIAFRLFYRSMYRL